MSAKPFDPRCFELAKVFAAGEGLNADEIVDLACSIQASIEVWFAARGVFPGERNQEAKHVDPNQATR